MKVRIRNGEQGFYVLLPDQVMLETGWSVGQALEVTFATNELRLKIKPDSQDEAHIAELVALAHEEALDLFEGDELAKERWMASPILGLDNRSPNQMLCSKADINTLRLLIARLESGTLI